MKIEFDIPDIERGEVVDAMARSVMSEWVTEYDDETGTGEYQRKRKTELAEQMSRAVRAKIDEVAAEAVRAFFDEEIKARVSAAVDAVLADGWTRTDSYGNAVAAKVDLKGRISEVISEKKRNGYDDRNGSTLAESLVKEAVTKVFSTELNKEIDAAKKSLREQVDAMVNGKVAEALKAALGVRS